MYGNETETGWKQTRHNSVTASRAAPPARASVGLKPSGHILLRPPLSLERDGGQHLLVRRRQRRLDQAPGPQVPRSDHVELGGVEGDLGRQVEEGQQAEDERERAVLLARVAQRMLHENPTEILQNRPARRADESSRHQVAPGDLLRREQPEGDDEETDVHHERGHHRSEDGQTAVVPDRHQSGHPRAHHQEHAEQDDHGGRSPEAGPEARAVHTGDVPDLRLRVLRGLNRALRSPEHDEDPHDEAQNAAVVQTVDVGAQLRPDHGKLGKGRVLDPADEGMLGGTEESEDRDQKEQKREQGQESVEGQERGQ